MSNRYIHIRWFGNGFPRKGLSEVARMMWEGFSRHLIEEAITRWYPENTGKEVEQVQPSPLGLEVREEDYYIVYGEYSASLFDDTQDSFTDGAGYFMAEFRILPQGRFCIVDFTVDQL